MRDFKLYVREGEFVCLLGHSGCGKTTVLSILMGLNRPSTGGIVDRRAGDRRAGHRPRRRVPVGDAAAVAVGARQRAAGARPGAARPRTAGADATWTAVGLRGLGDPLPARAVGGMQQRVGIARAFALEPRLLLLDEPFSLLDALTRMELQDELMALWERTRRTVIMVTHDVDEALLLADRIVLMTSGPSATIGRVLDVPFPRPRRREAMLARPDYFWLRDAVLGFWKPAGPCLTPAGGRPSARTAVWAVACWWRSRMAASPGEGRPGPSVQSRRLCAKAVHLPPTLRAPDRLLYPQVRARRGTPLERVPWELALRSTAERLRGRRRARSGRRWRSMPRDS